MLPRRDEQRRGRPTRDHGGRLGLGVRRADPVQRRGQLDQGRRAARRRDHRRPGRRAREDPADSDERAEGVARPACGWSRWSCSRSASCSRRSRASGRATDQGAHRAGRAHRVGQSARARRRRDRRDELGALARTFNFMTDELVGLLNERSDEGRRSRRRWSSPARSSRRCCRPTRSTQHGAFKVVGYCQPASSCGGDWWTYRKLSDGRMLLVRRRRDRPRHPLRDDRGDRARGGRGARGGRRAAAHARSGAARDRLTRSRRSATTTC